MYAYVVSHPVLPLYECVYLCIEFKVSLLCLLRLEGSEQGEYSVECYPGRWLGWSQLTCLHQPRFITLSPLPLAPAHVTSEQPTSPEHASAPPGHRKIYRERAGEYFGLMMVLLRIPASDAGC